MALLQDQGERAKENDLEILKWRTRYLKSGELYGERNTASWILFFSTETMIEYLNQRSCYKAWNENQQYTFLVLEIISFKKAPQSSLILQMLTDMHSCYGTDEHNSAIKAQYETITWLDHHMPIWSRLSRKNAVGRYRHMAVTKLKNYDIEIDECLWSLWGNLHPQAPVFEMLTRGKQYLACCVICLCAASIYRLIDWSPNLLDSIIVNGDRYLKQSLQTIKCNDFQFSLEHLDTICILDTMKFQIHIEMVAYGKLYSRSDYKSMNLAEALMYFFNSFQFGILQCSKKCLAIGFIHGNEGGYFMFDCQSRDKPLFPLGQGCAYILRTKFLQILLYCIVVTLNIQYYNIDFSLHKVVPQPAYSKRNQEEQTSGKLSAKSSNSRLRST
ncbi:hypothetical protein EVAR_72881_1 [Eumeta japonica]|uniref:Uncharacterized protein n=1 Tax=Eumeta variegata TaxID=151549 RepID=A0A4C1S800_EUMVA|nr:hypothetical protein EVAR_72881_1 [Eumeta japonica]